MESHGAEEALADWKRRGQDQDAERDALILAAFRAGLNIRRIHVLSGVSRTTIYKILGPLATGSRGGDGNATASR